LRRLRKEGREIDVITKTVLYRGNGAKEKRKL